MSGNNGVLSRDAFFAACKKSRIVTTDIPGYGKVNIQKLTLGQLREFDDAKDNTERAKMLIKNALVDGVGQPIFQTLEEVDDLEMPLFKVLSDVITDVNDLRGSEGKAKNSGTATTSASS